MNWRPEGWDNPYSEDKKLTKPWTEWHQSDAEIAFAVGADAMLKALREEIEKGLLTEKECMELSGDNTPLSSDEWEKVSIWARGLVANAQLQKILALLSSKEG